MKLMMHILKENKKLKINNATIGPAAIIMKLTEEYNEVVEAILNYSEDRTLSNLKEVVRETFDLVQMCILILWRSHRYALDLDEPDLIKNINIEHKDKLADRQWLMKTGIKIEIKE